MTSATPAGANPTSYSVPIEICGVQFSILGSQDSVRLASVVCTPKEPMQYFGILDNRLGVRGRGQDGSKCKTCGKDFKECVGHYGVAPLEMPVFHVGYFAETLRVLRCICKSCSRVLLPQDAITDFARRFRNPRLEFLQKKFLQKKVVKETQSVTRCPHCHTYNGVVKKLPSLKIIHELFERKGAARPREDDRETFDADFQAAIHTNKEIAAHIKKAQQDLTPDVVHGLLSRIPREDTLLLDMEEGAAVSDMVITHLHIPPMCIRPTLQFGTDSTKEDDLTMRLRDVMYMCEEMRKCKLMGGQTARFMELWDQLQLNVTNYIDGSLPGFSKTVKSKANSFHSSHSIVQRLKGKFGRFRMNLSGKRVDFSGRSVISPDPNLDITELAVPLRVAKLLTYPQRVFSQNIDMLRAMVRNGTSKYPGANYVRKIDGSKSSLRFDTDQVANELEEGDVVERHLINGDAVLFNRQPSLHRISMMCHRARVLPHRTFRFNECVCAPYNADFDGDEMNLHVPQTDEARAEAIELMSTAKNIITARNGEPIIAAMQDFLTGGYLLTQKDMFLNRTEFCQVITHVLDRDFQELPHPCIIKPVELWSGKQVLQVLVQANKDVKVHLNFSAKARYYTGSSKNPVRNMCREDGYITFFNSELISGCLDKKIMGGGAKDAFFFNLKQAGGIDYTAKCMAKVSRLTSRWLMNYGFSIGIDDVTPSFRLASEKDGIVADGYAKANEFIEQFNQGKLEASAGCTPEQTIEAVLNGTLSSVREQCGEMCIRSLHHTNAPLIMALCGSKGSTINIAQMVACVGQQTVSGKRIGNGFIERSTPHFPRGTREAVARGFVKNSFYTGLTPTEFFFHAMGGREGLVDSAVKTADTGYLSRQIMKCLEDLVVQYDYTVTNAAGGVIQFRYGEDGLDPMEMELGSRPLNFEALWSQIVHTELVSRDGDSREPPLLPFQARTVVNTLLGQSDFGRCSSLFLKELRGFCEQKINELIEARKSLGLDADPDDVPAIDDDETELREEWSHKLLKITSKRLAKFISLCTEKHARKMCEPGTPCGVIAAQSLGEPTTQMTLKTFHFAGVASMNISQGLPRIKEIMHATKSIPTPVVTAVLLNASDIKSARIVKGRIERTHLGDVAKRVSVVFTPHECFVRVKLCLQTIQDLQLDLTAASIHASILHGLRTSKHKEVKSITDRTVATVDSSTIDVYPFVTTREHLLQNLEFIKTHVLKVVVLGIPSAKRAIIHDDSSTPGKPNYRILVETDDLKSVMTVPGVDGLQTVCNHVGSVETTLGIESARGLIISEISKAMKAYGLSIDTRHIMLLADAMTFKGRVLGMTITGLQRTRDSVLTLASFERTSEHLFNAALHQRADKHIGVSESIILGLPPKVGTGLFRVLRDTTAQPSAMPRTLFQQWGTQFNIVK
eukprot:PhM_4_TR7299/c0_g1_i1/m.685/K03018/RPC1, POLR3A; DNA-directed RNA polymerase III subunit RPC1